MEDLKQKPLHAIIIFMSRFSIQRLPNFWFKDLQTWQTGVERHLMRLEPDVKLPWQEPLWNPEHCQMTWKLQTKASGIIIDKVLAKSSQPATVKNSAQDVETSHDQDPGKKVDN